MPLKLLKRGNVWYIRGAVCGTHVYRSTKLTGQKLALALMARISREIEQAHAFGADVTKTFGDACDAYLASDGSPRFLDPLRKHFGKQLLKGISQPELDAAARRLHPTASRETLNRQVYTPFIAIWNFAAENDWARPRKWRRPRRPRGTSAIVDMSRAGTASVDFERAARFVAAMSTAPGMLLTVLFYTGLRPIEAFALKGPDIDLAGRWLVVRNSKTGEPRGVPIHWFLCEWLGPLIDRAKADSAPVFRTPRGEPYTAVQEGGGGLKTAIGGARRRSGINDVSPYTARHTCSTGLVIAGVHPHIKDQILGHAADDMSRHYTNVPQAPLIEAINKLPVPRLWRSLPWWQDPLAWSGKLARIDRHNP
jgi:integrase/recombinase XerD